MSEPTWFTIQLVVAIHGEQLQPLLAGPPACVIEGMLEVGPRVGRRNKCVVSARNGFAALAASYAYGLARNHPFVDGNKRAAFIALITFLGLNGIDFAARGR